MIYGKLLCCVQETLQFSSFLKSGELDDHEKYFVDMQQLHMLRKCNGSPTLKVGFEC